MLGMIVGRREKSTQITTIIPNIAIWGVAPRVFHVDELGGVILTLGIIELYYYFLKINSCKTLH